MRVRPSEHHRVPTRVPGPGDTGRNPGASWGAHRTKEGLAPWWGRERSRWSLCGARSRGRTERGGLGTRPWCGLPRPQAIGGRRPGAPGGAAGPARTSRSLAPGAGPLRFADPSQEKQRGRAGAGACSLQARRPGGWCADPCAGRGPGLERAPSGSLRVAQRGVQGWGPTPGRGGAWVVPAAAQMKGTVGERVDPCWDPGVPGRPFCSWSRHREVETRGTEEEQPLRPAGRLPLGPASSFTHPAVPAGVGAIFTEGRIRTTAVRQVHIQAHGQTQPDSNPDLAPTFMFFLQKLCQSRVHRAEENTRQNKSLFHPPSNKSEDDPKDTEFKNGVSVETRSGRDSA